MILPRTPVYILLVVTVIVSILVTTTTAQATFTLLTTTKPDGTSTLHIANLDSNLKSTVIEMKIFHPRNHPLFAASPRLYHPFPYNAIAYQRIPSGTSTYPRAATTSLLDQYDAPTKMAYSVFSHAFALPSSSIDVFYYIPAFPVQFTLTQTLNSGGPIVSTFYNIGAAPNAPGFANHFPITIYDLNVQSPSQLGIRIGGLGIYTDTQSDLWKTIGFEFKFPSPFAGIFEIVGGYDGDGEFLSTLYIGYEYASGLVTFTDPLPKSTAGEPIEMIELRLVDIDLSSFPTTPPQARPVFIDPTNTSRRFPGTFVSITLEPTVDTSVDTEIKHLAFERAPVSKYLLTTTMAHSEYIDTISVQRRGNIASSTLYIGAQPMYIREMFWVGCEPATVGTVGVTGKFYSTGDRWSQIVITWGTQTSATIKCTRMISYTAPLLAPAIDLYGSSGAISLALSYGSGSQTSFRSYVPKTQLSIFPLSSLLQVPSATVVPYRYGSNLSSWIIRITEPGAQFPSPGDPYIATTADISIASSDGTSSIIKALSASGRTWTGDNPKSASSIGIGPARTDLAFGASLSFVQFVYNSPSGVTADVTHAIEVGTRFAEVPTKVNDPFTLSTFSLEKSTATSLPQFDIKLIRDGVFEYATVPSIQLGILHLPDFSLSWPAGTTPLDLDPAQTQITFATTLKPHPLYYPTDPAVVTALPQSSAWVLAPNFILYPGSSIRIKWELTILNGPTRKITGTTMVPGPNISQLKVTTQTLSGIMSTVITNPTTSPQFILPNNAADILTDVTLTFDGTIPQRAQVVASISIWSQFSTEPGSPSPTPVSTPSTFTFGRPPLLAALKVEFTLTSPVSTTWLLAGSSPTAWGDINTAVVDPSSTQAISPLALVSFSTPSGSDIGASVELSVWYYPELPNGTGYEADPILLKSLGVLADQSDTEPSTSVQLSDLTRGYSRAILRAEYTVAGDGINLGPITIREFPYFIAIVPACMQPSTSAWITPPDSSSYESSCPKSAPVCPESGICDTNSPPLPAPIKASFSLPSATSPITWDFTPNGVEPVWVPIGTSTVQPDDKDKQTITSLTQISFGTYLPADTQTGLKVEISLWHYPLLDATAGTYDEQPTLLKPLATIEDQADPTMTVPATTVGAPIMGMRIDHAFFRAVYTITKPGDDFGDEFEKDSQYFFTIAQACFLADEENPSMPEHFINNCPNSEPICSRDGLCSAPSLSPVQVTFSLPSSPLPLTWDISDGQTPVWGALGSATIHPTSPQAVSCSADISLSISDPSTAEAGISVDIDLWYYPQFGTDNQPSYSTEPIHLYHFPTISDQTNTSPTLPVSLTNGQVRGYSRAILRATYTITRDGNFSNRSFLREYEHFFSILPACQVADSVNWLAPPTIAQYENVCPVASPICPITGICKATTTPPPVAAPDICKTCHPDNSSGCDAAMTSQPCQCKSGWTGPTCSQSSECERDSTRQCISNKNGFVELINDTCDAKCTCYNEWSGSRCQICSLNCGSAGVAYNDCRRCGCQEGYTGDRCQCQQTSGSITLVNGKKNQLLEASNGSFLPRDANPQPFIISQLTLGTALPPSLTNEANLDLWELGHEVYDGLVEPFLGNPNGVFSLQLISIPSPQNPLLTQTTFSIQVTFGCADYNNDVKNIDALTTKWTKFVEGFIRYPVIEKYFGLDLDLVPGESPKPTPPTLPPDGEEYQGNGSTKAEIMIVFTLLSIVALLC